MHLMHYTRAPRAHHPIERDVARIIDRVFNPDAGNAAAWTPQVDIREDSDAFVLLADLPGVDPTTVEIWMDKAVLSIKGTREGVSATDESRVTHAERANGAFHRRFNLPDIADADGITASGRNGVLEVRIPKRAELAPRRIEVASVTA